MINEIKNYEVKHNVVNVMYFDFTYSEGIMVPSHHVYATTLETANEDTNLKKLAAEFLSNSLKEESVFNIDCLHCKHDPELQSRAISAKIALASYYIATNGRLGLADVLITNQNTSDKFRLSEVKIDQKICINDHIEDDVIYLLRHTPIDGPGLFFIHNTESNGTINYHFASIGSSAINQGLKIKITT